MAGSASRGASNDIAARITTGVVGRTVKRPNAAASVILVAEDSPSYTIPAGD